MGVFKSWKEELRKINPDLNDVQIAAADFWVKGLQFELEEVFQENNLTDINLNCYEVEPIDYGALIFDEPDSDKVVAEIEFGEQDGYYAFQATDWESGVVNIYNLKNYPNDYPKPTTLIKDLLKGLGFGLNNL